MDISLLELEQVSQEMLFKWWSQYAEEVSFEIKVKKSPKRMAFVSSSDQASLYHIEIPLEILTHRPSAEKLMLYALCLLISKHLMESESFLEEELIRVDAPSAKGIAFSEMLSHCVRYKSFKLYCPTCDESHDVLEHDYHQQRIYEQRNMYGMSCRKCKNRIRTKK